MNPTQCSLIPLFGEIESPDAEKYNKAFDMWRDQFSQFATLHRFTSNMTDTEQSFEQMETLISYVASPGNFNALLAVDFGIKSLNTVFKNFVWDAHIRGYDREVKRQRSQQIQSSLGFKAQLDKEAADRQASEQKAAKLLQLLELKEQLLSVEKEYPTELAAESSVYFQRAKGIADIKPVITEQKRVHGAQYDMYGRRIDHDHDGKLISVSTTSCFILTFECLDQVVA